MASWDSYTQKATPEDNDTLMIKDSAAGANKRTPFSGVWNWIVDKMTKAVISNLETTNKMIIPAINELNSKWIPGKSVNNIDYNDLTAGLHYCGTGCANAPGPYCRVMCLYSSDSNKTDGIQIAYGVLTYRMYLRRSNASEWTEWLTFSDDATVSLYQTMTSTNDVLQSAENQIAYQTKFYWLSGASYNGELPADSYKYGSAIVLKRASNSISVAIFSIGKPIYNSYSNGSWSGWRDFTGASV